MWIILFIIIKILKKSGYDHWTLFFFKLIILAKIYQLSVMGMIDMIDKICKVFILMVTTSATWKKIVKKNNTHTHTHTLSLSLSHEAMHQIEVEKSPGP